MRNFENDVQLIKYEVLREVAKLTIDGTLSKKYKTIPKKIIGKTFLILDIIRTASKPLSRKK